MHSSVVSAVVHMVIYRVAFPLCNLIGTSDSLEIFLSRNTGFDLSYSAIHFP